MIETMDRSLAAQKLDQAVEILEALQIDAWLTFVRETADSGDPVLPIILGHPVTWQSAFIVTRRGDRIAIVGKYEDQMVSSTGAWTEVISYVQSVREPLVDTLRRLDPSQLAINYSIDDVKADGLSLGMYRLLEDYLEPTPFWERLVSAAPIITGLRCRKVAAEVERIRSAIEIAETIFAEVGASVRPGTSERDIARFMHAQAAEQGVTLAWGVEQCPIVSTGSESMVGHGLPSDRLTVQPGRIFHIDFGVCRDEYCTDMQRAWYVPDLGETAVPPAVQQGFAAVRGAIEAAFDALRPGVPGWQVDAAARRALTGAGYPEYQHATGHHVGRSAHDGGGVLGPRWERYGKTPEYPVEVGNVLTLELGIENLDGRGYLGLEEMVLVTETGARWLSQPQTALPLLGA